MWGVGGLLFIWPQPGSRALKVGYGVVIGGLTVLAIPLYVLGERFKALRYRYFLYSRGVAQLTGGESEPRVLLWADVETVTITTETDEDGNPKTDDIARCVLSGSGAEITAGPGSDSFTENPGRDLSAAAHRNLVPRLIPALIRACESGEPVAAGRLIIDRDGLTLPTVTHRAWSEITSMAITYDRGHAHAPITRIDFRETGTNRDYQLSLSGIPNGIFLAHLIAHTATGHGVEVHGYQPPS